MKSEDVSALYDACEGGKYHTAVELIESEQLAPNVMFQFLMDNGPLLKFAAGSGNLKLVQYLHEVHHVSIESKGEYAGSHDTALSRACRKGHLEVAIYLMSKGANPNSPISYSSVLAEAIKSKKLVLVQELVSRGAKIDSLAISCALEEGVYDISQFLLQKNTGVDLSVGYALNSFIRPAVLGGCVRTLKMLIDTYKGFSGRTDKKWDFKITHLKILGRCLFFIFPKALF